MCTYLREICDNEVTRRVILEVLIHPLLSYHLPLLVTYMYIIIALKSYC